MRPPHLPNRRLQRRLPHHLPRDGVGRDLVAAFAALDLVDQPDGTGPHHDLDLAAAVLYLDQAREAGCVTWAEQAHEAVARLLAETRPEQMRDELLRAIALLLGWLYALDRRAAWGRPIPRVSRRARRRMRPQ
ncbi:hypothetical protein AB0F17_28565 [Nonomuraea sp. NPDC026600]|uniref:hypothetical protein n=1 Tax=Nonomuraea sp. NPDC026600 TaxID=3155363 RepID=UPI0033D34A0D